MENFFHESLIGSEWRFFCANMELWEMWDFWGGNEKHDSLPVISWSRLTSKCFETVEKSWSRREICNRNTVHDSHTEQSAFLFSLNVPSLSLLPPEQYVYVTLFSGAHAYWGDGNFQQLSRLRWLRLALAKGKIGCWWSLSLWNVASVNCGRVECEHDKCWHLLRLSFSWL